MVKPAGKVESRTFTACRSCFAEVGKGKSHVCTEANGVKNVTEQAKMLGANFGDPNSKSYQRVCTGLVKEQLRRDGIKRGEAFKSATGGNERGTK